MCLRGFTSRCSSSKLLGTATLPGAQAQYIRIPNAGGSLIPALALPPPSQPQSHGASTEDTLRQEALSLLLADILPTGYFAAKQAWEHPNVRQMLNQIRACPDEPKIQLAIHFAILGLGPVGLVSPYSPSRPDRCAMLGCTGHTRTSSKTNHDSNRASCSVRRYLSSTSPWSRTTSLLRLRYTPSIHWRVEDRSSSRWSK